MVVRKEENELEEAYQDGLNTTDVSQEIKYVIMFTNDEVLVQVHFILKIYHPPGLLTRKKIKFLNLEDIILVLSIVVKVDHQVLKICPADFELILCAVYSLKIKRQPLHNTFFDQ